MVKITLPFILALFAFKHPFESILTPAVFNVILAFESVWVPWDGVITSKPYVVELLIAFKLLTSSLTTFWEPVDLKIKPAISLEFLINPPLLKSIVFDASNIEIPAPPVVARFPFWFKITTLSAIFKFCLFMYVVVPITRKEPGIDIVSLMLPIVIERLIELILPVVIVLFAVNVTFPVKIESPTTNNLDFKYKSKLLLLLVILLLDIVNGVTEINDDNEPEIKEMESNDALLKDEIEVDIMLFNANVLFDNEEIEVNNVSFKFEIDENVDVDKEDTKLFIPIDNDEIVPKVKWLKPDVLFDNEEIVVLNDDTQLFVTLLNDETDVDSVVLNDEIEEDTLLIEEDKEDTDMDDVLLNDEIEVNREEIDVDDPLIKDEIDVDKDDSVVDDVLIK